MAERAPPDSGPNSPEPKAAASGVPSADQPTTAAGPSSADEVTLISPETADSAQRPSRDLPPDFIPGYTLLGELHRGGQGVVYQALQRSTKRRVAIKVMREGPFASDSDKARFEREVEILGQLNHPNIVTIHDSGSAAGCFFYVMDYIAGQSLDAWMAARAMEHNTPTLLITGALGLFVKICGAINAAHLRGIVHRDLKPANILVDADGEPHILDFGLAKVATGDLLEGAPALVTQTGHFLGSLPWASPEQAEAHSGQIDTRTDVYSLGVILYQMLTGHFPYEVVGNMRDVLDRIVNAAPARPSTICRKINDEVETIVLKCLQKERERRYQTAGDLGQDVARYLAGEPIAARRDSLLYLLRRRTTKLLRRHVWVAVLLIGVLATMAAHLWPGKPLIYRWANRPFEGRIHRALAEASGPFDTVRVVALSARTDPAQLARLTGLSPESLAQDRKVLRAVHGRLLERLAEAGPAVVAFDIAFEGADPYDAPFVRGVEALRNVPGRPCPVVVAANTWSFAADRAPRFSPAIAAATHWGCSPASTLPDRPWEVYLALAREGLADPLPSLVVRTLAAFRHPAQELDLRFDADNERLILLYWQLAAGGSGAKVPADAPDYIRATGLRRTDEDRPALGIQPGDEIARYRVPIPPDPVLAAGTSEYGDVLGSDVDKLRRQFAGRIVLICNQRDGPAPAITPTGRSVYGTYLHAAALERLVHDAGLRVPAPRIALGLTAVGALAGLGLGWTCFRRHALRWPVFVLLGAACVGLSFWAGVRFGLLYNPLLAVLALLIASELTAAVHRMHHPA